MNKRATDIQNDLIKLGWPHLTLGLWSFYFLAKSIAAFTGYIELDLMLNLGLVALIMLPLQNRAWKFLRQTVAFAMALSLVYYESFLPPFERLLAQWDAVQSFNFTYQLELIGRLFDHYVVASIFVFSIVYLYLRKIFNMTTLSLAALILATWTTQSPNRDLEVTPLYASQSQKDGASSAAENTPDAALQQFYEQQRRLRRTTPIQSSSLNVDILLLNICSLSWQDLQISGLDQHSVLSQADITLTNFYSGSSYSGPATIRLLRSTCGHEPHDALFSSSAECALGDLLPSNDWQHEIRMNHQGDFDNYLDLIKARGGMSNAALFDLASVPEIMRGFDQMPVYSDDIILRDWSNTRPENQSSFTLYNSISLHDGNQLFGFRGNSMASYQARASLLLDNIQTLFDRVKLSNRPTIIVLAPEHGAGLQGDRFQIAGMRELPTPALTHVPVMFYFLNMNTSDAVRFDEVTGPTAVGQVLTQSVEQLTATDVQLDLSRIIREITPNVIIGENEAAVMFEFNREVLIRTRVGNWMRYVQ